MKALYITGDSQTEVFFNDTNSGIPEFGGEDGKRAGG